MALSREKNPMWRGGRITTSDGYVLICVGKEHHLADIRGYAYEHRIIAEIKLGRRLLPGEEVHHKDENKSNNRLANVVVKSSRAEHKAEHRGPDSDRRMPNESNVPIECRCGCGEMFRKFDESGRPRLFVHGHNSRGKEVNNAIRIACECGCGKLINSHDRWGRKKRFQNGHNRRKG